MRFKDLIGIIWINMWKRKARTIFTMSGVIIGCLAVFIIVSITNGFEKYLNESMNGLMDTSVITVQPFWGETNEDKNTKTTLDDKCVEEIKKLGFVENVTPKRMTSAEFNIANAMNYSSIISKDSYDDIEADLVVGRVPRKDSKEIVLGVEVANSFLGYDWGEKVDDLSEYNELIGKKVKIGTGSYVDENGQETTSKVISGKVVGIVNGSGEYKYSSLVTGRLYDNIVQSQIYYGKDEINRLLKEYNEIAVKVYNKNNLEEYENVLKEMGYQTYSFREFEEDTKKILMGVNIILGSLAGVSLLVAALGITNTMDMAIYERNKEIGVIKVIGGDLNDVRKIFVGEACAISGIGGIISIILGLLISGVINLVAENITQTLIDQPIKSIAIPSISLVLGVLVFCLIIGFISGILPANKAAKTDVITAIR